MPPGQYWTRGPAGKTTALRALAEVRGAGLASRSGSAQAAATIPTAEFEPGWSCCPSLVSEPAGIAGSRYPRSPAAREGERGFPC